MPLSQATVDAILDLKADLLGHSTGEITELYYVKKDTSRLAGITAGFGL